VKRDIRKLDDLDPSERLAAFLKMFPGCPDQPVRPGRSFLDILKAEADDGDNDDGSLADHPIVRLARLLVASGKFPDHAQALDHLLNTSHGQALIARLKAAETEKDPPMQDSVHAIMKHCHHVRGNHSKGLDHDHRARACRGCHQGRGRATS
jgi:hypothetical protein